MIIVRLDILNVNDGAPPACNHQITCFHVLLIEAIGLYFRLKNLKNIYHSMLKTTGLLWFLNLFILFIMISELFEAN